MKTERLPWRARAQVSSAFSRVGTCLVAILLCGVLPAQAAGQDLRSSIDAAGSSMSRQLGEWLGGKPQARPRAKSTRKTATRGGRATMPAAAPLPPPRPDTAEAEDGPIEQAAVEPAAMPTDKATAGKPATVPQDKPLAPAGKPVAAAVPLPPPRPTAEQAATEDVETEQAAAETPVPPARPFPAAGRERVAALPPSGSMETEEEAPEASPDTSKAAPVPTICPELSNDDLGTFTPITVTATQAACTVDRGVSLSAVRMKDGRIVPLEAPAVLRCEMAAAVARWLRESVDPLVATLGSPLAKVKVAASQQCRSRNRVTGAKISEHGRGNALDTAGYVLKDGRELLIGGTGDTAMTPDFQEKLKASACADFTTILGPGSDGYHEKHLHVDRAERRSGAVLCQWVVSTGKGR